MQIGEIEGVITLPNSTQFKAKHFSKLHNLQSGVFAMVLAMTLASCDRMFEGEGAGVVAEPQAFIWPESLAPFGNGYPTDGAPCRKLGESEATSNYLDDSAALVGCPGSPNSTHTNEIVVKLRGRVVGETDGVTLISVPTTTN